MLAAWRWSAVALLAVVLAASAQLPTVAQQRTGGLAQVKRWGYQLEQPDVARLAASPHDLLVSYLSTRVTSTPPTKSEHRL